MSNPLVAVIIPTYNRWPHVRAAIDSVLAQSYGNVECVVVDDASTDGTAERLGEMYGDRIHLIAKPCNAEKSAARNDGVRATVADFVCMCDSDDRLTPAAVEMRMRLFLEDTAFDGVAYGVSNREDDGNLGRFGGGAFNGDVLDQYLDSPFVDNNGYLLSRHNMLKHGMYSETLTNREDVELLVRLMCRLPFRFCGGVVAEVCRVDNSARTQYDKIIAQGNAFGEILFSHPDVVARLGRKRCRRIDYVQLDMLAAACYKAGRYREFRQYAATLAAEFGDLVERPGRLAKRRLLAWLLGRVPGNRNARQ